MTYEDWGHMSSDARRQALDSISETEAIASTTDWYDLPFWVRLPLVRLPYVSKEQALVSMDFNAGEH
jgi:hypothetical protein